MPMRGELYIPKGHSLDLARYQNGVRRRILDDRELNEFSLITAFSVVGLFVSLYLALYFPLPDDVCAAALFVVY
jgi:hypothetical protein